MALLPEAAFVFSDDAAAFVKKYKRSSECNALLQLGSRNEAMEALSSRVVTLLTPSFSRRRPKEEPFIPVSESTSALDAAIVLVLGAGICHSLDAVAHKFNEVRACGGSGICIATKPFLFQGRKRQEQAQRTLVALHKAADLLLVIEHEKLLRRDGITVLEAAKISNDMVFLAVQVMSQLLSNKSTFYYDATSQGIKVVCTSDLILQLSGKGNVRFGSGCTMVKALEDAFWMFPLSEEERKGLVICALAKSTKVTKIEIQSAVRALRTLLGSEVAIICSPVEDTSLSLGVNRAVVIITGLEDDPNDLRPLVVNSVPGITSVSGFTLTEEPVVSNLDVSLDAEQEERRNLRTFERKRTMTTTSTIERASTSWDSGPHSTAARAWAMSRTEVKTQQSHEVSHSYMEVQSDQGNVLQPLPHDPAAVPNVSVLRMSIDAVLDACKTASEMMKDKDYKKQPSLAQRAASMLENERTPKSLSPSVEMDFKSGFFKGRCEGGVPDGKGRLTFADGSFYDGHWVQGKRNGMGAFYYANGDVYQGLWSDDLMHGKGWLYFHTGDRLQAEFVRGKAHGVGRYYMSDGSVLFGQFQDNRRHGECTVRDSSGSRWHELWDSGVLISRKCQTKTK